MSKFYIGQKIVAIKDHSQGIFKKGDEFTVLGITRCCGYDGYDLIEIYVNDGNIGTKCTKCNFVHYGDWFCESCFAPIELSTTTFEDVIKQVEPCLN